MWLSDIGCAPWPVLCVVQLCNRHAPWVRRLDKYQRVSLNVQHSAPIKFKITRRLSTKNAGVENTGVKIIVEHEQYFENSPASVINCSLFSRCNCNLVFIATYASSINHTQITHHSRCVPDIAPVRQQSCMRWRKSSRRNHAGTHYLAGAKLHTLHGLLSSSPPFPFPSSEFLPLEVGPLNTLCLKKPDTWDIFKYLQQTWTNINNFWYRESSINMLLLMLAILQYVVKQRTREPA